MFFFLSVPVQYVHNHVFWTQKAHSLCTQQNRTEQIRTLIYFNQADQWVP